MHCGELYAFIENTWILEHHIYHPAIDHDETLLITAVLQFVDKYDPFVLCSEWHLTVRSQGSTIGHPRAFRSDIPQIGVGAVCSVQCSLCSVQCAVCSVHCVGCCVQFAVCSVQCVVCIVQCAVCSVNCVGCSFQFSVCSVHCVVCSVQCAVCSVQCAVFTV